MEGSRQSVTREAEKKRTKSVDYTQRKSEIRLTLRRDLTPVAKMTMMMMMMMMMMMIMMMMMMIMIMMMMMMMI